MKIRISENIRANRKERKMTQEQLAEILGVTVGAVSKWESGASTPDLSLIVEMADFFETSVDVLLGYEWHGGSVSQYSERIRALRNEKNFEEAAATAEKAMQKYPNCFELTYKSAIMYSMRGVELSEERSYRRAIALFERSIELIGQNTDAHTSESTIRGNIADLYICLGQTGKALEQFKSNNPYSVNDGTIGYVLTVKENKPDEALPYLSDALIDCCERMFKLTLGYADAYSKKKNYKDALEALLFMNGILEGLKRSGAVSYLDKESVMLMTGCAGLEGLRGNMASAREYLHRAKEAAQRFDAAPEYGFAGMRFFHSLNNATGFDDFGSTAMEGVRRELENKEEYPEKLAELWNELLDHPDRQNNK